MARDDEIDLVGQFEDIIRPYLRRFDEKLEAGLTKAAEHLIGALEQAAPKDTGEYSKGFRMKDPGRYRHFRAVGNITMVQRPYGRAGEMPLSTILEYGTSSDAKAGGKDRMPAKPHIKATFLKERSAMRKIIKDELSK